MDWFSGQLAGPMLPLGRLKTHLMFFRHRIFYHEKTQSWDIFNLGDWSWPVNSTAVVCCHVYLLICTGFYQVCPPMVNYYFFPTVNVFVSFKELNIFNFAPHLIRQLTPNPSFHHSIFEACVVFGWKKWRCTWRSLCFLGPCFHRQRWKGYPVGSANKKNVAASHGMFETSGWFKDENLRDHWFPSIRPYYN